MSNIVFSSKGDDLYINNQRVLHGWESYSGWYWFSFKIVQTQDSVIEGEVYTDDNIHYGLVQGLYEEFGDFSEAELNRLSPYQVWKIPKENLSISGRRNPR